MRGETPNEQLLLNIQGAFAEYERAVISDRLRRGRLHRLRTGLSVPYPAPYGYYYQPASESQNSCWIVIDEQAQVVRQIVSLDTAPDSPSIGEIARRLNQQEIPAPGGQKWATSSVGRILRYTCYKGTAYYNRHQTDYSGIGLPKQAVKVV